jgi:hypothetical protein
VVSAQAAVIGVPVGSPNQQTKAFVVLREGLVSLWLGYRTLRIVSTGEPCPSRAGPRQGEGEGLDARGSKRIDAMSWSSWARSVADAPGRDIVSMTTRLPSTSMMYTALR